jgi:hypothetical protein
VKGLLRFFRFLIGFALLLMGSLVFWVVVGSYILPCHDHDVVGRILEGDWRLSEGVVLDNLDPLFDN